MSIQLKAAQSNGKLQISKQEAKRDYSDNTGICNKSSLSMQFEVWSWEAGSWASFGLIKVCRGASKHLHRFETDVDSNSWSLEMG